MVKTSNPFIKALTLVVLCVISAPLWAVTYEQQPTSNRAFAEEDVVQGIQVKLRPRQLMMGQPISLTIEGENLQQAMQGIVIRDYFKGFAVDQIDKSDSYFRVTLYPLHSGEFELQQQKNGELVLPQAVIEVKPNPEAKVVWQAPETNLFSQQNANWKAIVTVSDAAYQTSLHPPHTLDEAIQLQLPETQASVEKTRALNAAYQMPDVAKTVSFKLRSPVVHIKNRSNRVWKFFDAKQQLVLQPLPSFLPMGVAVGQIQWQVDELPWFVEAQQLYYWRWHLQATGMSADSLKTTVYRVLQQLHAENISWLSESIKTTQQVTENGLQVSMEVQIPFRVQSSGWQNLSAISLGYFNPHLAKVEQQQLSAQRIIALPSELIWSLQWLLLLLALIGFFLVLFISKQSWINWRFKQALMIALNPSDEARQAAQIWQILQQWQSKQRQLLHQNSLSVSQMKPSAAVGLWLEWYLNVALPNKAEKQALNQLMACIEYYLFADQADSDKVEKSINAYLQDWLKHLSIWPKMSVTKRYFQAYGIWLKRVFKRQ